MYERYWQLERNPFDDNGLSGFYRSETHQATLLKLRYLIENGKGTGALAKEDRAGGKFHLIEVLTGTSPRRTAPSSTSSFRRMSPAEHASSYLAVELGAGESTVGREAGGLDRTVREIDQLLRKYSEQNRHPVIVVDEAAFDRTRSGVS